MRGRTRWTAGALLALLATVGAALVVPGPKAEAAGVTTHAWMAADAVAKVTDPQLKALLQANSEYVRVGAHFPDSGYALSNQYGEEAHWQRFHDAYLAQILTHTECTDLTAVHGPCAPRIAFLMGMAAHGMGDEVWDWLFEPYSADLNEYYTPADLGGYANTGGAETQMDLAAVADYGQSTAPLLAFPDHGDILAAFSAVGFTDVNDDALNLGQAAMGVVKKAEAAWAPTHIADLHEAMPWMSHNMVTAPGGVEFAGTAIAGEWNALWGRLLGDQPQTSISITYPADGQRRVPATGWVRSHQPGSSPGRGGARTRVMAVMTYSRPYVGSAGTVSNELPAGSMTVEERDSHTPVSAASGWPRSVPYGSDAGEHAIGWEPAGELAPCTWYTASVTANLVDARNLPVVPTSWDFRTGTDAASHRCDDDPYTPDERFGRQATDDVLDRSATVDELDGLTYQLERWGSRRGWVTDLLGSAEERQRLVTEAFAHYLDRAPDPSGLAYWSTKLQTISLPSFQASMAASDEIYRKAGSTNAGYVAALYQLVLGRSPDPSGAAFWTARLDAGVGRRSLAVQLLTSPEAARNTVAAAFATFLDRAPDPSGKAHWTAVLVRGADPRDLWRSLLLSAEYDRRAQAA
jgi:hypothetical protein